MQEIWLSSNALAQPLQGKSLACVHRCCRTFYVASGDLVISNSLAKLLQDETKATEIIEGCRDHIAFVLPIFAIPENSTFQGLANSKHLVDKAVRMEKPAFVELVHAGVFGVFDAERYTRGQGSTMTSQWYNAAEPYPITSGQGWVLLTVGMSQWYNATEPYSITSGQGWVLLDT